MRRAVIGCLLLASVAGCNRAEKHSLKHFQDALFASIGHHYGDQLKGFPDPERKVQFRVLFARDQLAAADAYLASEPPIGATARREVDGFRVSKADELELFERLLAEKRYELTESERRLDAKFQADAQQHVEAIGRMVDN